MRRVHGLNMNAERSHMSVHRVTLRLRLLEVGRRGRLNDHGRVDHGRGGGRLRSRRRTTVLVLEKRMVVGVSANFLNRLVPEKANAANRAILRVNLGIARVDGAADRLLVVLVAIGLIIRKGTNTLLTTLLTTSGPSQKAIRDVLTVADLRNDSLHVARNYGSRNCARADNLVALVRLLISLVDVDAKLTCIAISLEAALAFDDIGCILDTEDRATTVRRGTVARRLEATRYGLGHLLHGLLVDIATEAVRRLARDVRRGLERRVSARLIRRVT